MRWCLPSLNKKEKEQQDKEKGDSGRYRKSLIATQGSCMCRRMRMSFTALTYGTCEIRFPHLAFSTWQRVPLAAHCGENNTGMEHTPSGLCHQGSWSSSLRGVVSPVSPQYCLGVLVRRRNGGFMTCQTMLKQLLATQV